MNRSVWIVDCKGTEAEIRNGVAAAEGVFARYRLTPDHCYAQIVAQAKGDAWGERGVTCWQEAESAAITECCRGWRSVPEAAHIELA
jgi:hypothetical protein